MGDSKLPDSVIVDTGEPHFYIPIQLKGQGHTINVDAMVDCGACTVFLSEKIVTASGKINFQN